MCLLTTAVVLVCISLPWVKFGGRCTCFCRSSWSSCTPARGAGCPADLSASPWPSSSACGRPRRVSFVAVACFCSWAWWCGWGFGVRWTAVCTVLLVGGGKGREAPLLGWWRMWFRCSRTGSEIALSPIWHHASVFPTDPTSLRGLAKKSFGVRGR